MTANAAVPAPASPDLQNSLPPPQRHQAGRLPAARNISLDFFRGIMALIVCIGHLCLSTHIIAVPGSFTLAVDFFLVLSGFVICRSVTRQKEHFDSITFAKNRFLRLFPVYIVCVILFFPFFLHFHLIEKLKFFDLIRIVTISEMLPFNPRSRFFMEGALGHCWTISAELYSGIIFFPVYSFLMLRGRNLIFPLGLAVIIWTGLILNNSYGYFGENWSVYGSFFCLGLLRCIFDYTIGILTYLCFIRFRAAPKIKYIILVQLVCITLVTALCCRFDYHHHNDIFLPFIFALFIGSLAFRRGFIYRYTANGIGSLLGDISYPLYIIHPFFLLPMRLLHFPLRSAMPEHLIIAVYLAVCVLSAWLINRLVEKPCLKLLKK